MKVATIQWQIIYLPKRHSKNFNNLMYNANVSEDVEKREFSYTID